jgi:predicted oxidoreductase
MTLDAFSNGVLDQCQQYRIRPMAWSPLAGGRLFSSAEPQAERLRRVLYETGHLSGNFSMEQIALAWLLHHPAGIIPVLGSGNIERIKHAVEALKIQLSADHWFKIWMASTGTDLP